MRPDRSGLNSVAFYTVMFLNPMCELTSKLSLRTTFDAHINVPYEFDALIQHSYMKIRSRNFNSTGWRT